MPKTRVAIRVPAFGGFHQVRRSCVLLALCAVGAWAQGNAQTIDLSRMVVGDSLSAEFQNFSLLDTQQVHGFPSLIAQQAHVTLTLPLIPPPGIPNALQLVSVGPPPVVAPGPGTLPPLPRDNPTQQATNLAVPGMVVADVLNKRPSVTVQTAVDALTNLILGFPSPLLVPGPARSQVEQAAALNPTTIFVWIGSNDILLSVGGLISLDGVHPTNTLHAILANAFIDTMNAQFHANIPDVNVDQVAASDPLVIPSLRQSGCVSAAWSEWECKVSSSQAGLLVCLKLVPGHIS